jgi:hypothetical protein
MVCNCGNKVDKSYDLHPNDDEICQLNWKETDIIAELYECYKCGAVWELYNKQFKKGMSK